MIFFTLLLNYFSKNIHRSLDSDAVFTLYLQGSLASAGVKKPSFLMLCSISFVVSYHLPVMGPYVFSLYAHWRKQAMCLFRLLWE